MFFRARATAAGVGLALLGALLSACTTSESVYQEARPPGLTGPGPEIFLVRHGWHTQIEVPLETVPPFFLPLLPPDRDGGHYVMMGFGAKGYFDRADADAMDGLQALLSADGALQISVVTDLLPADGQHQSRRLRLSPQGYAAMLRFVAASVRRDPAGHPRLDLVQKSNDYFYDAKTGYSLGYNCNDWTAEALRAGGVGLAPRQAGP